MKIICRTGLCLLALALISICQPQGALAEETVCFQTNVTRIGVLSPSSTSSGYRFEVEGGTCEIPENTPFFIGQSLGNAGLATLLTAFSMDKTITMRVDPMIANSQVSTIHVDR